MRLRGELSGGPELHLGLGQRLGLGLAPGDGLLRLGDSRFCFGLDVGHRLRRRELARQAGVRRIWSGESIVSVGLDRGSRCGDPDPGAQHGRAGVLGTSQRIGELVAEVRSAALPARRSLALVFALDLCVGLIGHAGAWLARGPGRAAPRGIGARWRGERKTQVHPSLEHVDARSERRDLAAGLAKGEQRLAIALGQAAELGQELAKG